MRVIVLGETGMLGSELVRVQKKAGNFVIGVSRSSGLPFDALNQPFSRLEREIGLDREDLVINAIGWIPQKKSGDDARDKNEAWSLNAGLPKQLAESQERIGFRWLQIATDCVFSGSEGGYSEDDPKDASDLYGDSKIQGEAYCKNAILIRASIIGPDQRTNAGLYSWFRSQPAGSSVGGYLNHLWNGVTTTAFARLSVGIASSEMHSLVHHWIPNDFVSKFELLTLFSRNLGAEAASVQPKLTEESIDRRLQTKDPALNLKLWRLAGYDEVPSIPQLVSEMVQVDQGLEQ